MINMKRTHPSADRNSAPIANALKCHINAKQDGPDEQHLLEIASGSGQHAGYLAPLFPRVIFHPSECDATLFPSIEAYSDDCATKNIRYPVFIDISKDFKEWQQELQPESFDYILNCNMLHISPWACAKGLFNNAGILLKKNGKLFIYGPFAEDGVLVPESNVMFDKSLKSRNPEWGVRDIACLKELAGLNKLHLMQKVEMPSNNKLLIWSKQS